MSAIPTLADCKPGLRATGFNIIVAVQPAERQTPSGLWKPDSVTDKEQLTEVKGRIVSMSPAAFDFASFGGETPATGDIVQFARLAGIMTTGADGREYRVLADKDVIAIVEEGFDNPKPNATIGNMMSRAIITPWEDK